MARKDKTVTSEETKLCAILVAMRPSSFDRKQIVSLIGGDRSVSSMPMVAKEFGLSSATIKQSWKANGMPGGDGSYPLADIVMWKLQHDRDNEKHTRSANSTTELIRQIELDDKRFEFEQKQQKAMLEAGKVMLVAEVQADLYALITMVREMLLTVPRSMAPMLPTGIADETLTELTKQLRHCLTALANGRVCGIDLAKLSAELGELIKKNGPLKSLPIKSKGK